MHLSEIQSIIYDRLGEAQSPGTEVTRRILSHINQFHREVLGKKHYAKLRMKLLTAATVADSPYLVLPIPTARVRVINDRTNGVFLHPTTLEDIRASDPNASMTGNPQCFTPYDWASPVSSDPSAAATLYAVSSSASDTAISAYLDAIRTGGHRKSSGAVTLTGTTPVSLGITNVEQVQKFFLSAAAVGTVTLTQGSGGDTLATIPIGETYAKYSRLLLYPTPSSALTMHVDAIVQVSNLTLAQDVPLLPDDFHWILAEAAIMMEYILREKPILWAEQKRRVKDGMDDMLDFMTALPSSRKEQGWSQLGAYYEEGT